MSDTTTAAAPACTICLTSIDHDGEPVACPTCQAPYHLECWTDNRGCGVYGCQSAPQVELRTALEIPVSYWGQENKPCPGCGRSIAAAAVRCRHCGVTFSSAQPQDAAAFRAKENLTARLPGTRRTLLILFSLCILPLTAPLGVVLMGIWYPLRLKEVRALPSFHGALCKIGLGIGLLETAAIIFMSLLYGAFRAE
ncbi:RING finger protein [Prosthecobacter sp.]|uniref:RING finger protein n=1 Tax=Prosthecobacter sp. TaxID=1965333 RepID=UPI0037833BB5